MTTVCDDVLETARGAVAALRASPPPAADTGIPVVLCPGLIGSKEDYLPLLPALADVAATLTGLAGLPELPGLTGRARPGMVDACAGTSGY
ncbi:hypothetical protein AB0H83_04290 [Dactylosporangium sp. NPDC050688]|uniref:hypothetical protein n=1 Tax=Dactylosporangium sp. NPDC050688 TaxID=3157217 RepID=UPI0033E4D51B